MGKIDELIQQYCPDGVEYVPIGDYLSYEQPTRYLVESTKYDDSYTTPVLTAGQSFILGYTKESSGIFDASRNNPVIIFDDFTTSFHWVEFSFKVKSSAMKMLRPTNESKALFRYLYHCMKNVQYVPGDHTRQWIGTYSQFEIPLPPLPVQEAIVNILDRFAVYAAELQAELQARQQQYNYYRDTLLSFEGRDDVQWKKLGELCPLITKQTGFDYSNYIKDKLVREKKENHIPYIQTKFFTGRQFDFNTDYYIPEETAARFPKIVLDTKCILLSIVGASIGNIGLYDNSQKSFLGGAIGVAKPSADVNTEFIYYYLTSHSGQKQIFHKVKGAGQATITIEDIREFLVPQPSLSEQQRIVDILDRFDTLVNDLTQGLPAEIEARQQQYEYYRDQLLTFKRKEA